jgi:hypothetical protein
MKLKQFSIIIFVLVLAILSTSCKKDTIPILTMGDTSGLIVTNHNITFELDTNFYVSSYTSGVDLDQDGSNDLSFKMYEGNPDLY